MMTVLKSIVTIRDGDHPPLLLSSFTNLFLRGKLIHNSKYVIGRTTRPALYCMHLEVNIQRRISPKLETTNVKANFLYGCNIKVHSPSYKSTIYITVNRRTAELSILLGMHFIANLLLNSRVILLLQRNRLPTMGQAMRWSHREERIVRRESVVVMPVSGNCQSLNLSTHFI